MKIRTLLTRMTYSLLTVLLLFLVSCDNSPQTNAAGNGREDSSRTEQADRAATTEPAGFIKAPNVAGQFYPSTPSKLRDMIRSFLDKAEPKKSNGNIRGIIAPHAGYIYSGPVAAWAYKSVSSLKPSTVILLSPSHTMRFKGAALLEADAYRTPLGKVTIDLALVRKLATEKSWLTLSRKPFEREHALEVHLPFLQFIFGSKFKLVPIIIGEQTPAFARQFSALLEYVDVDSTLIVASTDMSHYFSRERAQAMDSKTLQLIEKLDSQGLFQSCVKKDSQLCGMGPVLCLMEMARRFSSPSARILRYADSGHASGDTKRVVGYCSVLLTGGKLMPPEEHNDAAALLSAEDKKNLLTLARQSITTWLNTRKYPDFTPQSDIMKKELAVFVTLHKKGSLRGCIGHMEPRFPLYDAVRRMAVQSATGDPRFPDVRSQELDEIDIEISVLTPMEKVNDVKQDIRIGRDGLLLRAGRYQGVFLPQVPVEQKWNLDEYLSNLSRKAGMFDGNGWKKGTLYTFQAIVFGEKE